jgi:hypothetical protein
MSQKSSVPQAVSFVSVVLKRAGAISYVAKAAANECMSFLSKPQTGIVVQRVVVLTTTGPISTDWSFDSISSI